MNALIHGLFSRLIGIYVPRFTIHPVWHAFGLIGIHQDIIMAIPAVTLATSSLPFNPTPIPFMSTTPVTGTAGPTAPPFIPGHAKTYDNIPAFDKRVLDGVDWTIVSALLIVSMCIGAYYAWKDRAERGTEEFFMGGRQMKIFPVSLSLMATFINSSIIIGWPLDVYFRGTQVYLCVIAIVLASVVAAEIFVPLFYNLKMNSINEVSV